MWDVVEHESVVQVLPSAQSPSKRQQPGTGALLHVPLAQESVVQTLPSLQSASLEQHPGTGVNTHSCNTSSQLSVVQVDVS